MESIKLDPEQHAIFNIMESSHDNIFVTGKAGSGKSVLLKYFVEHTAKEVIVLAPTGIAAIQVGGQTIHSFFAFDYTALEPEKVWINDETAQILQKTDAFIIDEISMVRSDIMECINRKCQIARSNELPFGGVQMIVFGDLYQLPPVVAEEDVRHFLNERFGGSFFFNAPVIKDANIKIYELERIYRQDDSAFQNMLNEVRVGAVSQETLNRFNARCDVSAPDDDILTIATTNKIVDKVNDSKFNDLPGTEYVYEAKINGDTGQLLNQLGNNLRLKVGAQVMMLRNYWQNGKLLWANGTLGEVAELSKDEVNVRINGIIHDVKRVTWETLKHKYDMKTKSITKEAIGELIQFPLCLAWAFTIHKSQGQTYKSVIVNFGKGAFLHGQAYVALSRCRFLNTLYLMQKLRKSDIIIDKSVVNFINKHKAKPGNDTYERESESYNALWKKVIQNLFHYHREIQTINQNGTKSKWISVSSDDMNVYVDKAKLNTPSSSITLARTINRNEFVKLIPLYYQWRNGNITREEAKGGSMNSSYIFALINHFDNAAR